MKSKIIPTKESWHPALYETKDINNDFISGSVEVRLYPPYNGKHRVSVWGGDDLGMEIFVNTEEDAYCIYDALDVCPSRNSLKLWGFGYA